MKTITKYFTVLLFVLAVTITAQQKDYTNEPGYVEFGDLAEFETGESVTEIYLNETLLQMVAKITKESEPEMTELLNGLKLIKVNAYEVTDENESDILDRMKTIDKKLTGTSWQRIVRRIGSDETAYVYVRTGDTDKFTGLVVLALDRPGEAAFVNIVGDIDLTTIGKLTNQFNIPALHNVNHRNHYDDEENEK